MVDSNLLVKLSRQLGKDNEVRLRVNEQKATLKDFLVWWFIFVVIVWFVAMGLMANSVGIGFFEATYDTTIVIFATIFALTLPTGVFLPLGYKTLNKPAIELETFSKNPTKVEKVLEPTVIYDPLGEVQSFEPEIEELSATSNDYLLPHARGELKKVGGTETTLYHFSEVNYNLGASPHTLIIGSTGGGKTVTTYNIIKKLLDSGENVQFCVIDMGFMDYSNCTGRTFKDFQYALDQIYKIMLGRQREGKGVRRPRLVWLVEEYEDALAQIKTLPSKEQAKVEQKLSSLARMARKTDINLLFICQSAKAELFNTSQRNNFDLRLLHKSPKNLSGKTFDCSYDISNLPSGVAWFNKLDAFVQFDLIKMPPINILTFRDLSLWVKSYEARFGELSTDTDLSMSTDFIDTDE